MTGDVAQRIALVGYGNAFLAGSTGRPPDLFSKHSAFKHDRSIEFRMQGRSIHRVDLWFAALARRGVGRLWLRTEDIAAEGGGVREVWIPSSVLITQRFERDRWRAVERLLATGDRSLLDSTTSRLVETERPWRLYYDQEPRKSKPKRGPTLEASRTELVYVLTDAQAFCRRHGMGFVGEFGESLALLRTGDAVPLPHSDLLPRQGYADDARRLLAAAQKGWVFGPWGWSDTLTGADSVMHEFWLLDARLRASVIDALIAATNAFDGSQKGRKTT